MTAFAKWPPDGYGKPYDVSIGSAPVPRVMEVTRPVRWRQAFMLEVSQVLHQLGMEACPVCRSIDTLTMSPSPAVIFDGELPFGGDDLDPAPWDEPGGDLTFAVRMECAVCGHLMLFNSQKFRAEDEKILVLGADQEHES